MKEAVTKVIDTLTQEEFHGAFQTLLERYNKCIAAGGDYFEGDERFMSVLSIQVPIRKKSGNLSNDPRNRVPRLMIIFLPNVLMNIKYFGHHTLFVILICLSRYFSGNRI